MRSSRSLRRPTLPASWVALAVAASAGCRAPASDLPLHAGQVRWTEQSSGMLESLRGVCAVDQRTAWASGTNGTWARTTDGGETWTRGVVPDAGPRDFRDVEAFDGQTALVMAVGSPGEIWRTDNGGASWQCTWSDARQDVFLDGMAFWDDRIGLAFGDPVDGSFQVLRTTDGGHTWTPVPPAALPAPKEGEAGFAASGSSLAVGSSGRAWIATGGSVARVLVTRDFGVSWSASETPLVAGRAGSGGFSLAVLPEGRLALVGGDHERPEDAVVAAAWSEDHGRTWRASADSEPTYRSAVVALPEPHLGTLLAVSPSGASLSPDGGRSWSPFPGPAAHALDLARAVDGHVVGWAVGAGGRIARLDVEP